MKIFAVILSVLMFGAVVVLSQVDTLTAQCASANAASLELREGSMFQSPDGVFFYTMNADWDTKGKPFLGVVSTASGTIGAEDVNYFPTYFFPGDCSGRMIVTIVGRKVAGWPVHLVNHLLNVGPRPYNAQTATAVLVP